jgi:GT2 family glycosyltransferase
VSPPELCRPAVSVVMPFAGDQAAAAAAIEALLWLELLPGDELILADNSGTAVERGGVEVIRATRERSPAHARNAGAARARNDWVLFLDADCRAPRDLLDAYFAEPVADDVAALAGEVVAMVADDTLAARYGSARSFLSQQAHMNHPYRPRAVAANLLVRREAFEQVGGFYEGVRAAEDTDFSWRLQEAGWRLDLRRGAWVEHRYRATLGDLRRQWRGYAAGRAWLARRYEGFEPQPAVARAFGRARGRFRRSAVALLPESRPESESGLGSAAAPDAGFGPDAQSDSRSGLGSDSRSIVPLRRSAPRVPVGHLERGRYLALDVLLSAEELAGLALSNRPAGLKRPAARVVVVADRFPVRGDPLAEFARALDGVRVEATARPELPDLALAAELDIDYREDDGIAARIGALAVLTIRHPVRVALDLVRRRPEEPGLLTLAPAVRRLERDSDARVHALGGPDARAVARRIGRLGGRTVDEPERSRRLAGALRR